jgi:hypothetical protein
MAPYDMEGLKDYGLKLPLWLLKKRPGSLAKENKIRQGGTRNNS